MLVSSIGRAISTATTKVAFCRSFTMRVHARVVCASPSTRAPRLPLACPSVFLSVPRRVAFSRCTLCIRTATCSVVCCLGRACLMFMCVWDGCGLCCLCTVACLSCARVIKVQSLLPLARSMLALFFLWFFEVQSRELGVKNDSGLLPRYVLCVCAIGGIGILLCICL